MCLYSSNAGSTAGSEHNSRSGRNIKKASLCSHSRRELHLHLYNSVWVYILGLTLTLNKPFNRDDHRRRELHLYLLFRLGRWIRTQLAQRAQHQKGEFADLDNMYIYIYVSI